MKKHERWLVDNGFGGIASKSSLSGGCINQVSQIISQEGTVFCVKENPNAPPDFFACEADNLRALQATKTVTVPEVLYVDKHCLLLEFIEAASKGTDYWQNLAQQLASCHSQTQPAFGFTRDNYCGETPQQNRQTDNGYTFFAEQRLLLQAQWARDKGLLTTRHCQHIEKLAHRLEKLIPPQSPALLHGDLWGGNLHCDRYGQPVLIDPACYWGWPEADLAMTTLFGGFDAVFYQHYHEFKPMESDWRQRFSLYNLYHLLNHLNLFGSAYLSQVENVLRQYV